MKNERIRSGVWIDVSVKPSSNSYSVFHVVQFADDHKLSEAQSALRRRWDFVESRKRLVADVQFDNLTKHKKSHLN